MHPPRLSALRLPYHVRRVLVLTEPLIGRSDHASGPGPAVKYHLDHQPWLYPDGGASILRRHGAVERAVRPPQPLKSPREHAQGLVGEPGADMTAVQQLPCAVGPGLVVADEQRADE